MGSICSALENSRIWSESLSIAAFQADMLAFSTKMHSEFGEKEVNNVAVFVASNGKLAYSAPFDAFNEVGEIEKLVAMREAALPKIAWEVKQNPEKWLCTALSSLLTSSGTRGSDYQFARRRHHAANLKLIADAVSGTTAEHRASIWRNAKTLLNNGKTPVLAFLISDPALRLHWFSARPAPHFEAVVSLDMPKAALP